LYRTPGTDMSDTVFNTRDHIWDFSWLAYVATLSENTLATE